MKLSELHQSWEHLAKEDPLWAILSDPAKKGCKWDLQEFLASGEREIDAVVKYLNRRRVDVPRGAALDFGCGVGRLTQALCEHFEQAVGIDISETMIHLATEYNAKGDRCRYILNQTNHLPFDEDTFDFVFSSIVLQHIEPRHSKHYIREFIRVLKPEGVALFQIPSNVSEEFLTQQAAQRAAETPVAKPAANQPVNRKNEKPLESFIQMHAVHVDEVSRMIEDSGVEIIEILKDGSAGMEWDSYRYCARKPKRLAA